MKEYDLSIIIPSRNEEFLNNTIDDIIKNKRGDTQIIVGLDGQWPLYPIYAHPDVVILFHPPDENGETAGQRAISNQCVKLSRAKYIMKVDAHCSFEEGFDVKMMEKMEPDITMVPVMKNLHAFDWVCPDGHRRYQGPSGDCSWDFKNKVMINVDSVGKPKEQGSFCGKPMKKELVWLPRSGTHSVGYAFDTDMHFQYWNEYGKRQKGDLIESMSIQGSCFMVTRDKWWELDICSEEFHSWGQQGVEVACKTWLSGGRVLINKNTWYAHMFRTQGGDFGFPYDNPGTKILENRQKSRELFEKNKWGKAIHPFSWLINKFKPPGWKIDGPTKGILYYTDNRLNMKLAKIVREKIKSVGLPITSVSLKPLAFGQNIYYNGIRGYATMFKQILAGLEAMTETVIYFVEHDILYHPYHFDFTPKNDNTFYYNGNYWHLRQKDGFALHYDCSPLSGLVVYREAAIKHFRERVEMIDRLGEDYKPLHMGFEPFTHGRVKWKYWCPFEVFLPEYPNIDIAHGNNTTWKRWKQEHFIRKPKFWEESNNYNVPGWENLKSIL